MAHSVSMGTDKALVLSLTRTDHHVCPRVPRSHTAHRLTPRLTISLPDCAVLAGWHLALTSSPWRLTVVVGAGLLVAPTQSPPHLHTSTVWTAGQHNPVTRLLPTDNDNILTIKVKEVKNSFESFERIWIFSWKIMLFITTKNVALQPLSPISSMIVSNNR